MHVSEQLRENQEVRAEYGATPVTVLSRAGLLDENFTAVHAIHITAEEIRRLGDAGASVCSCPTAERNLGDGILKADELLQHGVRLAVGTDSQAQISPLEDAREIEYNLRLTRHERAVLAPIGDLDPNAIARKLWSAVTNHGASSLGCNAGTLAEGKRADFVAVDLADPSLVGAECGNLLATLLFGLERTAIKSTWVAARQVWDRRHREQDSILSRFSTLQKRLWADPNQLTSTLSSPPPKLKTAC